MKDSATVAQESYAAYVRKDRAAIEELIDHAFHFTSPLDNRIDRKTYFERCWPNSQQISRFDFVNVLPDGDKVFVTYERHQRRWRPVSQHRDSYGPPTEDC